MTRSSSSSTRCAIILAGGEGLRLRHFVWRLRGDLLPKQYVRLIGNHSLLERTFRRVEKIVDRKFIFTVVAESHLRYPEVRRQLSGRPPGTVVIQPENKDTGPGLLLPLMHVIRRHPNAVVTVFPSDHFIEEENLFMGHADLACRSVERDASRLILLGMKPLEPETEYGYILPQTDGPVSSGILEVSRFVEKPGPTSARELLQGGGLWNTLVMAFSAGSVLERVRDLFPIHYGFFRQIAETIDSGQGREVIRDIYRKIEPFNFSKGFLENPPVRNRLRLSVLPVQGVWWSDWGSEDRIRKDLDRFPSLIRRDKKSIPISAMRLTPLKSVHF